MFKKNHFVKLSKLIHIETMQEQNCIVTLNNMVDDMCAIFVHDNPAFDEQLFRKICGKKINQTCIINQQYEAKQNAN